MENTVHERQMLVELERCPACSSGDIAPFYASTNKNGPFRFEHLLFERLGLPWRPVRYDACTNCGLAFLNPRWTSAALGRIYGPDNLYRTCSLDSFFERRPGASELDYFRHIDATIGRPEAANHHHLARARFIRANLPAAFPAKPLMADVGAGFGGAQRAIEKAGFEYRGFESSPEMVQRAAGFGRRLENVPFAEVPTRLSASAHVVYTAQFLEHVDEPVGCLAALRPCLVEGGYAFVDVPVCHYRFADDALLSTRGTRRTRMNWGHMNMFSFESLSNTFRLAGFAPVAHTWSLGNLWMLGRLSASVPAGPLLPPNLARLDVDVHVVDPMVEPLAKAVGAARNAGRDLLGSLGVLSALRAARLRALER